MLRKKLRSKQQQSYLTKLVNMGRKLRGFASAHSLARLFGGEVKEYKRAKVTFTARELIDFTRDCNSDPAIVGSPSMARKIHGPNSHDKHHEIVPDLVVGTDKWADLVKDLIKRLNDGVKPSESIDGVCDERAVVGDWNTLASEPGKPMQPLGYPICDNTESGLAQEFQSERHAAIFDALLETMFGQRWRPQNGYQISAISTSSIPEDEYDVEVKIDRFTMIAKHVKQIMELWRADKLREIAERFKLVFTYFISRRNQNDTVVGGEVKARTAPSAGQAAGYEDGMLIAGRTGSIKGFWRTRSRVVYAGPGPLNYFLSCIWQPIRDYYLNTFAFTWKHTGRADLQRKLTGWLTVGVDASQFDQNFPDFIAQRIFNFLKTKMDEDVVEMHRIMWNAPAYCPSPVEGQPDQGVWFGHPFKKDTFRAVRGLPSGIAYNPDFGKIWGTAYVLFIYDDLFNDVLEVGLPTILRGEHPAYGVLNMGDDAVMLTKSPEVRSLLIEKLKSGEASPYIKLDVELILKFLGMVPTYNGVSYQVHANIISMVVNFICHEHSIGHPRDEFGHRKHWALGVEAWAEVFGECPEYEKVRTIIESVFLRHMGKTLSQIAKPYAELSKDVLGVSGLNDAEARLLDKPSRRFYSVDMDDIRPQILDTIVRTIDPLTIEELCGQYIHPSYK